MAKRRRLSQKPSAPHATQAARATGHASNRRPTDVGVSRKQKNNSSGAGSAVLSHKQQQQQQRQNAEPVIPFEPGDKILLVGEGDLSFAASLIEHHYCADVTATVLEKSVEELTDKYPHVVENIARIEAEDGKVLYNVDVTKMGPYTDGRGRDRPGVMDRIIFNFPHVGGKSTDVNRQVRYNQELLVSFFQRALPSLAPGGSIIVTLFEGEPYTLWNIRDLARHVGLQVERSFRFQASAYPGYHHARTLGVVRSKSGQVGGGWRGEDRPARSYVFVRKDEEPKLPARKSKKRQTDGSESSEGD